MLDSDDFPEDSKKPPTLRQFCHILPGVLTNGECDYEITFEGRYPWNYDELYGQVPNKNEVKVQ